MVSGGLIKALEDMALGVQSGLDRGVTKPLRNNLWVPSMSNEKCCVGVAERRPSACVTSERTVSSTRRGSDSHE